MHRIDTSTAKKDKFGAGKNGFTGGNPQTGELPTALDADFFDSVQEEIAAVIEAAGISLAKTNNAQLLAAMKALVNSGRLINVQSFTASGTYIPTKGTRSIIVEVLGGGGGGGGASSNSTTTVGLGGGGGGGGYAKSYLTDVPTSQAVTVGIGGAPYTAGGDSKFGNIIGRGGVRGAQQLSGTWKQGDAVQQRPSSPGGQAENGNLINAAGSYGNSCLFTVFGNCISGCGGGSFYSGTTFPADGTSAGTNGAIGCGGSGAASNGSTSPLSGGSGGNGIVMIWEYA